MLSCVHLSPRASLWTLSHTNKSVHFIWTPSLLWQPINHRLRHVSNFHIFFFKFKFKLDYRYWACLCSWYIFFGITNVWTKRMKTKRKQSCKYRDYGTDLCIPRVINAMAHGKAAILSWIPDLAKRGGVDRNKVRDCAVFLWPS